MLKILFLSLFFIVQALSLLEDEVVAASIESQDEESQFDYRSKRAAQPEGLFGALRDFFRTIKGEVIGEREIKKNRSFKLVFGDHSSDTSEPTHTTSEAPSTD